MRITLASRGAQRVNVFTWNAFNMLPEEVECIKRGNTILGNKEFLLHPFSKAELETAVRSLRSKSASGPDLITNEMLKKLPPVGTSFLLKMFNRIFNHGNIPESWKSYNMIFIPKPGSDTYRPISLANCIFKLFEKIIFYRLKWWIERHKCLPLTQFGFRKAKSCIDNVTILHCDISEGLSYSKYTGALFLDIKGVFDNVVPEVLIRLLEVSGIPPKISKLIRKFIITRKVKGYMGGRSLGVRLAGRGVSQSSTLSPILYNIYSAFIAHCLPNGVKILQYADDIVIYFIHSSINQILDILNQALTSVRPY